MDYTYGNTCAGIVNHIIKIRDTIMVEVCYCRKAANSIKIKSTKVSNSLIKIFLTVFIFDNKVFGSPLGCPQEAEELFVATERNAKLRYEGYKKLSEM